MHQCSNDKRSMMAIYIDKILWLPWLLTQLVCCRDHPITALSTSVMIVGIHFEHMIGALIFVPIALIHSEHVFTYITEMLRATIGWCWQQTRHARSNGSQEDYQYNWPTYYSCHYCIDAIKQYNCIAILQNTLYCNMINQSLSARYVMYHHKYDNLSLM